MDNTNLYKMKKAEHENRMLQQEVATKETAQIPVDRKGKLNRLHTYDTYR